MSFERKIRQALRWMQLAVATEGLAAGLVIAAAIAVLAALARKLALPSLPLRQINFAALGAAALVTAIVYLRNRPTRFRAALALDQQFGLQERFITALHTLQQARLATPDSSSTAASTFSDAILEDANRHAESVSPRKAARCNARWQLVTALVLAVSTFLIVKYLPARDLFGLKNRAVAQQVQKAAVAAEAKKLKELEKRLAEPPKDENKLTPQQPPKAAFDIAQLQKQLADGHAPTARDAMAKLSSLAEKLDKERQDLKQKSETNIGGSDQPEVQPAEEQRTQTADLERALRRGDMERAAEELDRLQQKASAPGQSKDDNSKLGDELGALAGDIEGQQDLTAGLGEASAGLKVDDKNRVKSGFEKAKDALKGIAGAQSEMRKIERAMEDIEQSKARLAAATNGEQDQANASEGKFQQSKTGENGGRGEEGNQGKSGKGQQQGQTGQQGNEGESGDNGAGEKKQGEKSGASGQQGDEEGQQGVQGKQGSGKKGKSGDQQNSGDQAGDPSGNKTGQNGKQNAGGENNSGDQSNQGEGSQKQGAGTKNGEQSQQGDQNQQSSGDNQSSGSKSGNQRDHNNAADQMNGSKKFAIGSGNRSSSQMSHDQNGGDQSGNQSGDQANSGSDKSGDQSSGGNQSGENSGDEQASSGAPSSDQSGGGEQQSQSGAGASSSGSQNSSAGSSSNSGQQAASASSGSSRGRQQQGSSGGRQGQQGGSAQPGGGSPDWGVGTTNLDGAGNYKAQPRTHSSRQATGRDSKWTEDFIKLYDPRVTQTSGKTEKASARIGEGEFQYSVDVEGKARHEAPKTNVTRAFMDYREAQKDALSKDDIPTGYKEFVKGYFDSIDPPK